MPTTARPPWLTVADRRWSERRDGYRAAGVWDAGPLDLVARAAHMWPDQPALVSRREQLTYRDLDAWVGEATAELAELGVGPDRPVLVVVGNDIGSVVGFHAAVRSGSVVLVASATSGRGHLEHITEETDPAVIVVADRLLGSDAVPTWTGRLVRAASDLRRGARGPQPAQRPADEPSVVLYTSGTTSAPKGVVHSLSTLLVTAQNFAEGARITQEDGLFVVSPLASVTGLLQAAVVGPWLGTNVALEDAWDPPSTAQFLVATACQIFGGPDIVLNRLLDEFATPDAVKLRAVYVGGASLNERILSRFEDDFGIVVLRSWGMTEAPVSSAGRVGEPRELRHASDGGPLRGVDLSIGSANDDAEVRVRGPHLFLGYVGEHGEHFEDGWFLTSDLGVLDDGRFRVIGRLRDMVIRKGLKVPMNEVEAYAQRVPGVHRAAAYRLDDPETGERLAMALLLDEGADISLDELTSAMEAQGLARWKLPEEVVIWDEPFPQNAAGKLLRDELAARAGGKPRFVARRLEAADAAGR